MSVAVSSATSRSSPPVMENTSGLGQSERAAGLDDAASGEEEVAGGRGDEVDLEFGGQHAGRGRHQRESGVAGGAVGDGGYRARMDEAVLLRDGRPGRSPISTAPGAMLWIVA